MDARTALAPVLREVVALAHNAKDGEVPREVAVAQDVSMQDTPKIAEIARAVWVLHVVVALAAGAQVSLVLDTPKLAVAARAASVKVHQEWDVAVHVVATT